MQLKGVIVPLLTPLNRDESLDIPSLERHIEHVLDGGVSGIFLLGSTGEFPHLSPGVKRQLIIEGVRIVRGRVPVLAGVNEVGTHNSVEFARQCVDAGVGALVASAPYYYSHSTSEVENHLRAICTSVDAPVALYNIPQRVKHALSVETVRALTALPNVIGLKDSAGDMAGFQSFLALREGRANFQVWQGSDPVAALSVARGADGLVLGQSNVAPRLCVELYRAAADGDLDRAWRLQEKLTNLFSIVLLKSGPAGMKAALSLMGICQPHATAPFEPLTPPQIERVAAILEETGIAIREGAIR